MSTMTNDVYDYQNEILGGAELDNAKEGFSVSYINSEIILKTILFTIIFYILTNNMFIYGLKATFGKNMDINIIQTIIFCLVYYFLNIIL
jgi:hypothetical protein